ncbi:MAG: alpha/beta hydrolase [Butyricicoccus pullicaecorum]|nr:alpha/beta hydrolase [Butyricicoccus pullicaecorum]
MDDVRFVPRFVQSGDAKIAYYTWGSGEPLVLLHGNGEDSRYFRGQIPVFARRFRVIAVDSRGHGRSGHGACGLHFAQMADDLKTVFDALGLQRAHILGFSDGGNLAITFALRYPQQVDKLVLNGANLHMLTGVKPAIQLPLYPVVGMLSMLSPLSARLARKRDVLGLMARDYGVDWDDLRKIPARTLVLVGENDMIFDRHSWRIALCLPHGRLYRIPGGDHFCAAKLPAQFNLAVLRFLMEEST